MELLPMRVTIHFYGIVNDNTLRNENIVVDKVTYTHLYYKF